MLRKIYELLFKYRAKNSIAGSIIPIVKTVKCDKRLTHNMNYIKMDLIHRMYDELMQYTEFEIEEQENGVTLVKARLDVLRRDKVAEQAIRQK